MMTAKGVGREAETPGIQMSPSFHFYWFYSCDYQIRGYWLWKVWRPLEWIISKVLCNSLICLFVYCVPGNALRAGATDEHNNYDLYSHGTCLPVERREINRYTNMIISNIDECNGEMREAPVDLTWGKALSRGNIFLRPEWWERRSLGRPGGQCPQQAQVIEMGKAQPFEGRKATGVGSQCTVEKGRRWGWRRGSTRRSCRILWRVSKTGGLIIARTSDPWWTVCTNLGKLGKGGQGNRPYFGKYFFQPSLITSFLPLNVPEKLAAFYEQQNPEELAKCRALSPLELGGKFAPNYYPSMFSGSQEAPAWNIQAFPKLERRGQWAKGTKNMCRPILWGQVINLCLV